MFLYFKPFEALRSVAKRLATPVDIYRQITLSLEGDPYRALIEQLGPDAVLFGAYSNGIGFTVPHIASEDDLGKFEREYQAGNYIEREFFAVPKALTEKHCGRAITKQNR